MPIQLDDILLNKASIIERCIKRIREEYDSDPNLNNYTHIDAMTLNIERGCQAAIDMAMHIIAEQHLGIPQSSAEAFLKLKDNMLISQELYQNLKSMTGFRNIAIHEYQKMNHEVLHYIAQKGYRDFIDFCSALGLKIKSE